MKDLSNIFKNAVINLYKEAVYTVDYAIIEASKLADKNKINARDYEELIAYLAEEQEKSMQEDIIEETEEVVIEDITVEEPIETPVEQFETDVKNLEETLEQEVVEERKIMEEGV